MNEHKVLRKMYYWGLVVVAVSIGLPALIQAICCVNTGVIYQLICDFLKDLTIVHIVQRDQCLNLYFWGFSSVFSVSLQYPFVGMKILGKSY